MQLDEGDSGYHRDLKPRQIRMIAIGGAIGTGLFLGAGGRLAGAGPGLIFVYAITGVFAFLMLRAMGELVLYRPSSGAVVSYAREFYGEKLAFVAGWMYWMLWAITSVVDVTAAAIYLRHWRLFAAVPQWVLALAALAVVLAANLVSVKVFGELEFWFAIVKVATLVVFLAVGVGIVTLRMPVDGHSTGPQLVGHAGGWLPHGLFPLAIVIVGVAFAYSGIELIGVTAGETENPAAIMPRAVNSVVVRILVFYIGAVLLLVLLLPYSDYRDTESPFVTFFSKLHVAGAENVVNFVVLTAALSSINAGMYSTGRILRSMAVRGTAPSFTARISRSGVPYGGVALTATVTLIGIVLNYLVPRQAFEIALNVSSLGTLTTWSVLVLCQLRLLRLSQRGVLQRPAFRMPLAPYSGYATLVFVVGVLVLMAVNHPIGTWTVASLAIIVPLLMGGWYLVRGRVVPPEASALRAALPPSRRQ